MCLSCKLWGLLLKQGHPSSTAQGMVPNFEQHGGGSTLNHPGTADFGPCCHLPGQPIFWYLLWMDEILHHLETMGNHYLLVFTGESSFQGSFGGAEFRPSTVFLTHSHMKKQALPVASSSTHRFAAPWRSSSARCAPPRRPRRCRGPGPWSSSGASGAGTPKPRGPLESIFSAELTDPDFVPR